MGNRSNETRESTDEDENSEREHTANKAEPNEWLSGTNAWCFSNAVDF